LHSIARASLSITQRANEEANPYLGQRQEVSQNG
jgi:hypothetical protein